MLKDIVRTLVRLPFRHDRPARLGVVANTYGVLPSEVAAHLAGVDLILHAGDVGEVSVITRLEAIAPVIAVAGDFDRRTRLPQHRLLHIHGKTIGLTHGHTVRSLGTTLRTFIADDVSEARDLKYAELLDFFPPVDCLVFAHPATACRIRLDDTLVFNPGPVFSTAADQPLPSPCLGIITLGRMLDGTLIQGGETPTSAPRLAPASERSR